MRNLLLISIFAAAAPFCAANLVSNPGFETGNFTSWTIVDNASPTSANDFFIDSSFPHSGSFDAAFGPAGGIVTLSQTFAVIPSTFNRLSFWLFQSDNPDATHLNSFSVSFDGTTIASLSLNNAAAFTGYQFFTATVLAPAVQTTGTLTFSFRNDPGLWSIDDIFFGTPEPGTLGLTAAALIALGIAAKKRRTF